jgi:hypothetical protein
MKALPSSAVSRCVLLALCLACEGPLVLDGTWRGEATQYLHVTLSLTQQGDSLRGSGSTLLAAPFSEQITSPLWGSRNGDTVYIRGNYRAPSVGGGYAMVFAGRLVGSRLVGDYQASGLLSDSIVLDLLPHLP